MEMSAQTITVEFIGPFSWIGGERAPSILEAEIGKKSGVYLWTVQLEKGELVYYVGETGRSFAQRMLEHFREHMSGGYHLYEPQEFSRGRKVLLWPGRYGPDKEPSLSVFVQRFQGLTSAIVDLAELYRFYVAPLECEKRLRERIEASIANHLYEQPGIVGEFQDQGIVYRARKDTEEPVQALIWCKANLIGVPEFLWV
jgi:hypothetical protein